MEEGEDFSTLHPRLHRLNLWVVVVAEDVDPLGLDSVMVEDADGVSSLHVDGDKAGVHNHDITCMVLPDCCRWLSLLLKMDLFRNGEFI